MTTHKIGTFTEFMQWTKKVITDPVAAKDGQKQWFDSEETAVKAGKRSSPEALVKLLSAENLTLLHVIGTEKPDTLQALADRVGRKQPNLSRTLKKLEEAGIVRLDPGPRHTMTPRLVAQRVTLDLDLMGKSSSVLVAAPSV